MKNIGGCLVPVAILLAAFVTTGCICGILALLANPINVLSAPASFQTRTRQTAPPSGAPSNSSQVFAANENDRLTEVAGTVLQQNALLKYIRVDSVMITHSKAVIDYKTTDLVADQNSAVSSFMQNLPHAAPSVFEAFPSISTLELEQRTDIQDADGNTCEAVIVDVVMTRSTSAKIDWKNLTENLPIALLGEGNTFIVRPIVSSGCATSQSIP